ncbi:MAG: glucose dehydrogenase, partial [Chloroflexi bacterium]|nr:glucose dehydrogenase [Chloroflexota bacterium]
EGLEPPLFAYHTLPPWCTVIGGHVYRGKRVAGLQGAYVYADFCGLVRAIRLENRLLAGEAVLVQAQHQITSFGVDEAGELYVLAGRVYHLAARE